MTSERFGFDVEMLYLARRLGYLIHEVPVVWRNSPQTRVHVLRDALSMLWDLLRIRWHDGRGRYDIHNDAGPGFDHSGIKPLRWSEP